MKPLIIVLFTAVGLVLLAVAGERISPVLAWLGVGLLATAAAVTVLLGAP